MPLQNSITNPAVHRQDFLFLGMVKQLALYCFFLVFMAGFAQQAGSTFSKENIGCIMSPQGSYLHLGSLQSVVTDVYLVSGLCSSLAGNIETAAGQPALKDEMVVKLKNNYYTVPVRLFYNNATPVSYFVADGNANMLVLSFDIPTENNAVQYNYLLLEFSADGKLFCFEVESKIRLKEERVITKYDIAKVVGVVPVAEKINTK